MLVDLVIICFRHRRFIFCWPGVGFDPVEKTVYPGVCQSKPQNQNKDHCFCNCKPSPPAIGLFDQLFFCKNCCPWKKQNDLHFKQQEYKGYNIEANIELRPCVANGFFPAFISGKLFFVGPAWPEEPGGEKSTE